MCSSDLVSGSDATAGLAGCSSTTYSGPDNPSATVNGSCTDKAGNDATWMISPSLQLAFGFRPIDAKRIKLRKLVQKTFLR